MPLVEIAGLHKTYDQNGKPLQVLRGIDLSIESGELLAIVGESGAGKSTLLHCIGTLDLPSAGTLKIDGREITTLSSVKLAELRNHFIGFVFQFHHLLPEFTAIENVAMPGLIQGKKMKDLEGRARELLGLVGLSARATHRPSELSGGEQQRVAVARSLALEPKILLMDEPTGNLDSKNSESVHDLFLKINRDMGTTIIIVTHNNSFAERLPRVVHMSDGLIQRDERRSDYRA